MSPPWAESLGPEAGELARLAFRRAQLDQQARRSAAIQARCQLRDHPGSMNLPL